MKSLRVLLVVWISLICCGSIASAAPKKKPGQPSQFFPAGAQRGQTITTEILGEVADWPVQVWVSRPGITATAAETKGKLKIEVAADAPAGTYWLRLYTDGGASQLRPFIVGTLPEIAEVEPNDAPEKPQPVDAKVVINGKLEKSGDVDGYQVKLQQGETLVAAVQAHNVLGSPMDGILQICQLQTRPASKFQPAEVEAFPLEQNHDANGLDPLLAFTATATGDYLVRVFAQPAQPDSSINFAGGGTYVYRLTLTTGSYLDQAFPLALPLTAAEATFTGWNLPASIATKTIAAAAGETELELFQPEAAGTVVLPRSELALITAAETSGNAPQEVPVPAIVSGRFESPGDVDRFLFAAKKGEDVMIEVASRSFGSVAIPLLAITDEAGKVLLEKDGLAAEAPRDFSTPFKAPADGKYVLELRDAASAGGPRRTYRVTLAKAEPDFALTLTAGNFVQADDQPLEIVVTIDRRHGFKDPLEVQIEGLPAGVIAEPVASPPTGDAAKSVKLIVKRTAELAETFQGPVRIVGRSQGETKLTHVATFVTTLPRTEKQSSVWLTVPK